MLPVWVEFNILQYFSVTSWIAKINSVFFICIFQSEICRFKAFAAKVERKVAENAALEEDYDDAPDEFKGECVIYCHPENLVKSN